MSPLWRRLKHSPLFIAAAVVFLTSGAIVGGTYASFTAETQQNTSTLAAGWIGAATSLAAPTPSGYDSSLSWTAGTHGPVTGQQLYYQDNGSSSTCPTSGYTLASNSLTSSSTSATASNPYSTTLTDKVGFTTLKTALPAPTTINMVGGINASATSLTVTSAAGMPGAPFDIQVDTGANLEHMTVTHVAGMVLTVTRGVDGTTGVSHANGASVNVSTVVLNAATTFPSGNGYTFQIGTEDMTVLSGGGTATVIVTRGALSTTIATQAANAPLNQVSIPVANGSDFPQSGNFTILVDSEQMTVTGGWGTGATTFLVNSATSGGNRGVNSTTIAAHASGAHVFQTADPAGGHYFCYQIVSTSASSWTATATFPASQIGLVATGLTITNTGTKGTMAGTDAIAVTFNQATTLTTTGANASAVCYFLDASGNYTVLLGDTTCTTVGTDPYDIKLTGVTGPAGVAHKKLPATRTVSGSTATYSIQSGQNGTTVNNGTWTLIPSQTVLSNATTDQALACIAATICQPTSVQDGTHGF